MSSENRALIIVDVQLAFCEGGVLGVTGGNDTARKIADFVTKNADEYSFIVTTQDWHIDPGKHFSNNPDFAHTWPLHGLAGTAEAELHAEIAALPFHDSVKKGEYTGAYSGFEGKNDSGEPLETILRNHQITAVDVAGISESFCVRYTALDALRIGWPVRVFSDLTVPVSEKLGLEARKEMDEAGIEQIPSSEAFGFYQEQENVSAPNDTESNLTSGKISGFTFGRADSWGDDSDDSWDDFADESDDESYGSDYDENGGSRWDLDDSWNSDDAAWDDSDSEWGEDFNNDGYRAGFESESADDPSPDSVEAEIAAATGKMIPEETGADSPGKAAAVGTKQIRDAENAPHPKINAMPDEDLSALADFADFDLNLDDFDDLNIDFDEDIDFSDEATDEDFDFSDIDFRFDK